MFNLIDLPYSTDALEPVISARTLEFHHVKQLQAYVDNLNRLLPESGLEDLPLEEIVVRASKEMSLQESGSASSPAATVNFKAIFNNAGQVLNHNLYFTQFKPAAPDVSGQTSPSLPAPTGNLLAQIEKKWGSLDSFRADFDARGVGIFGSGWVWLSAAPDGTLVITQEQGAGNPVTRGLKPLLTFDVWEHAYYLDYQNRRAAHLSALWQIVDWDVIEARFIA